MSVESVSGVYCFTSWMLTFHQLSLNFLTTFHVIRIPVKVKLHRNRHRVRIRFVLGLHDGNFFLQAVST